MFSIFGLLWLVFCASTTVLADGPPGADDVVVIGDASLRQGAVITSILPLPDGRLLTAGQDGTMRLWDLQTGQELQRYVDEGTEYDLWCGLVSPGRSEVFACGDSEHLVRWDLETGEQKAVYEQGKTLFRMAISPDHSLLAIGDEQGRVRLWDLETGKKGREIRAHKESVYTLAFTPDGRGLITGSDDNTICHWSVATGECVKRLAPKLSDIYTIEFSPDGKHFLAACGAKKDSVLLFDAETHKLRTRLDLPKASYVACWSPDGLHIAVVCHDDHLYVFDAETHKQVHKLKLPNATNYALSYSLDGKEIYCGLGNILLRIEAESGKRLHPPHDQEMRPGSTVAVAGLGDGRVAWAMNNDGLIVEQPDRPDSRTVWLKGVEVEALATSPDGQQLLVGTDANRAYVLDAAGQKVCAVNHGASVTAIAWLGSGEHFATAGYDDTISIWNAASGERLHTMATHDSTVRALAAGPLNTLLSTSHDQTIRIWDPQSGREIGQAATGLDGLVGLGAMPDLDMFLTTQKGRLQLWQADSADIRARTQQEIAALVEQLSAKSYQQRQEATEALIEAGPKALRLLQQQADGSPELVFRIRHIRTNMKAFGSTYSPLAEQELVGDEAGAIAIHPNGQYWAAIEGKYGTAKVLVGGVIDGRLQVLPRIDDPGMAACLAFAPDGRLLVGNRNGTVSVYSLAGFVDKSKIPAAPQAAPAPAPAPAAAPVAPPATPAEAVENLKNITEELEKFTTDGEEFPVLDVKVDFTEPDAAPASQPASQPATQPATQPASQPATGMDAPEGVAELAKAIAGKRAELDKQRGKPGQYEVGLSGDMIVVKDTHTGKTTHYRWDAEHSKLVYITPEAAATQPVERKAEVEQQNRARELEKGRQASEGLEKVAEAIEVYKAQQAVAASQPAASQPTSQPAASQPAEAKADDEPRARGRWVYEGGKWVRKRENDAPSADE
jgi:WD40 repeat protein